MVGYIGERQSAETGISHLQASYKNIARAVAVTFFVLHLSSEGSSILPERSGYFSNAPLFRVLPMTLELDIVRSFPRLNNTKVLPEPPAFTDLQTKRWNSVSDRMNVTN